VNAIVRARDKQIGQLYQENDKLKKQNDRLTRSRRHQLEKVATLQEFLVDLIIPLEGMPSEQKEI
jgi:hypothetical protein